MKKRLDIIFNIVIPTMVGYVIKDNMREWKMIKQQG